MDVAVLGYGTVGSGVVEVLERNREEIKRKTGVDLIVKYVLDLRDFPGDHIQEKIVHDFGVIAEDPDIRIVAESMGGIEPAYTFTKKLLEKGKSVCTSNKELVAARGTELMEIAEENHANYLFEASCGGGIPIIRPLHTCLLANEIDEISGILNGTTNYMLTRMAREGSGYEEVLKEAQAMGYAERNPAADVEGYDPCRKIAILASIAFGKFVDYKDVYTEGITEITAEDFRYAAKMKGSIKLLGSARRSGDKVYVLVSPMIVWDTDPLYAVNDVFNAIFVHGNMLGGSMYYGRGAGKLPTASAVAGDVIDMAVHGDDNIMARWDRKKLELSDISESEKRFFVRVTGGTERSAVEECFGPVEYIYADGVEGEYGFLTGVLPEAGYTRCAEKLGTVIGRIRVRDI